MAKFTTMNISDEMVNDYLFYKNLKINRKYSSNSKKISKIDHYEWWFTKQRNRHSFKIFKDNTLIFISTCDHIKFRKFNLIYSGLISCLDETNLFDILKGIKLQNEYLDNQKGKFCFISIKKNNKVLLHHWKYFKYVPLEKKNLFYNYVKSFFKIDDNSNIYYKKVK